MLMSDRNKLLIELQADLRDEVAYQIGNLQTAFGIYFTSEEIIQSLKHVQLALTRE